MEQKCFHFLCIFYLCYWLHFAFANGQSNGDLRLSLGNEGILEIYYSGTWGYVCSDGWDEKDSSVACRNLGLGKVKYFQNYYYHPNRTEEFKINDVNCTGNENSLLSCDHSFTVIYCDYNQHIYLDCSLDHCQSFLHNAEYSAQLVRYFNGVDWFYICKDNFSEKNAHVICYENYGTEALNYTFLSSSNLTANYSFYPYQFNCEGEEASLCNCPTANQTCESSEFVAVFCKKEVPSEGSIRLTNDDQRFLQAYINSEWIFVQTYCYYNSDDSNLSYFLSHAMDIACRELGYSKVKFFQLSYLYDYYYQKNFLYLGFCPLNATKLSDCSNFPVEYNCGSRISLRCEAETCATSLQFNSTSNSYQLAQTYVDKSWFYICPDSFTKFDADVICGNSEFPGSISFGHVPLENLTQVHPISPDSYACTGNESSLCSCPSNTSTCNSNTAVNVLCHEPNIGSIRLSNGYYGYVEVDEGGWKIVCDSQLNSIKANIICKSAGYRRAESFSSIYHIYYYYYYYYYTNYYYYFGAGYLTVVNAINDIHCFGNETSLLDCSYAEYSWCGYESVVTCEKDGCESLLRNPESLEAVQIYIDQWYSMCEDNFTQQTADIICRENHNSNASSYTFLPIQPSNYPISPFYFQCDGNENSVCACEMISQQCSSNRIVHVECRKPSNGYLRLSNGTSGILEVYLYGWDRVCSRNNGGISPAVSNVACRYLGYRDAEAFNPIYTNYATTNIFSNPRCFGNETNILECAYDLASSCYYDSYISCRTEGCQSYIFGENTSDQPVRMYMNENWNYICSNSISTKEADVICRENGFLNGVDSISYIHKSQLEISYEIYPYNITCNGNESSLCDCSMMQMQCTEGNIAEIRCSQPDQGTLRYSNQYPNMLEIYNNGGWSHICRYNWDNADSSVACRQLGYTSYSSYSYTSTTQIATSYPNNFANVSCDGTEYRLVDCSYSTASCQSFISSYTNYKVLLYCSSGDCEVFAPYATQSFQIVEYFVNQQRYYLCADGFTAENADVVCKDTANTLSINHRTVSVLNLPPNTQIYPLQHSCLGNETSLCNCSTFQQSCSSGSFVEIQCGAPDQGTLRYSDLYSNVLEIYYNGSWSYICPYSWSNTDSAVACRQLGFIRSTSYSYYYYRTSIATSFLNNFQVSCNGNESNIIDCSHTNDTCYSYSGSNYQYTYYLRLYCTGGDCEVHAPFATEHFQIVEYFVNQQRYYLCADEFTRENADVVCRETTGTLSIAVRSVSLSDLPLNTQIYPLQHLCFGNESSLCNCTTSQQSCQNGSVVEVQCGTPEQEQIRLTSQNRLLFYYNQWRHICSQRWDTEDSDVACRQLGYRNSVSSTLINDYSYYNYYRANFVTDVTCFGNETQLSECRYHLASYCDSSYTISLTCQPDGCESYAPNAASYPQIVRYYSGGWYHLCGDGFNQENADVVCRENEGSTALSHSNVSNSDLTSGLQILERRFTCTGRETSLCDCSASVESCPSNNVIQLQCNPPAYGHIRLANRDSGVLEIYLNQWGYVCDDGWNRIASEVVCKQLGLDRLISYETRVEVNDLLYPFLIDDVECNGNESTIFECTHTLRHNCGSGEHVSITCGSDQTMTTPTIPSILTSTITTLTTSTTTVPTTFTTPFIGIAPKITSPGMNITKTLNKIDAAIPSIECAATGDPTPDIFWSRDLTTKFIESPILQINITDLSTDKVFYCVAENSAGRDVVSVTFKIVLTTEEITSALEDIMDDLDEVDSISDDKSGQTADMTKVVIDASNENIDIEGEEKIKILENAAMTAQTIVEKTNGTFSNETTESITGLLSAIVNGSSDIQESESTVPQQREESAVATVPSALAITLNTLERFSQRLSEELANSEVNSVKTVVSQLITIVVQNVVLESSEDGETNTEIELPMKNSDDVEYSVMITLSMNLAATLSTNGTSLTIATSIVKRIESKVSDSGQPTQGSDILTVALAGRSGIVELTENVTFSFDVYSNQPSESTCVFLNGISWVSNGLSTDQETSILTNCESSHLTSFAVFVTPYKNSKTDIESIVLSAISYLFVGISFIFLLISLIIFIIAGKAFFKVEANIIYFNYCLSMLLATGLFVFGIQVGTYNNVLCNIIAFLLHYSWLSVFTWTLCVGILIMYKIVINVLSTKKIYKYLILFGWGFPLIIPVITIAVARDQYVDASSHCFLNVTGGVIWAFIGPILIMILINAVFLIIALIQMIRTQSSTQNNETRNIVKNALITGLVLTPVLGLPWLILIFNVTIQHSVLEWIFIIINGAMGFVFFLVVVLRNREVLTRFKRNKQTAFANAHQSSKRTALSSSTPSSFTSNRFRKTNTLERHLVKESEIQSASIEQSEICKSPYETMDYQNNIYEIGNFDAATPGKADENMTGYDNPFCTSDALDDAPVYHNLSNKEIVTEVISNPMYMQSPSAGYTNELYSTVGDVIESDTQVLFNPDEGET